MSRLESRIFLPASDIPRFVGLGNVDLGITGRDVILESQMKDRVRQLLPLGFGKCKLQVQVPEHGPIQTVEQLAGKRVVTSFNHLAGEFFDEVDHKANLVGDQKTRIEYVGGSVEAACALGLADGIVDLVESGETMRAAGLHAIATVLDTEAVLITGKKADGDPNNEFKHPEHAPLISLIVNRIEGVLAAGQYVICQYNISKSLLPKALVITPGRRAPTVSPLLGEEEEWVAVSAMVEKKAVADTMDQLVHVGAHDIFVVRLENCRQADLGAFQTVFFALSQLHLHHNQQNSSQHNGQPADNDNPDDFTRSNTPSNHPMSPLTLDSYSHPPSRFTQHSASSNDTEPGLSVPQYLEQVVDGESDIVLAVSSPAEDGDEESLAISSPKSRQSSDEAPVLDEDAVGQDDNAPRLWAFAEISPTPPIEQTTSTASESEEQLQVDGPEPDAPSLGDLESAFAFFAAERAKLAKQLEMSKGGTPVSLTRALPSGSSRSGVKRGGKPPKRFGWRELSAFEQPSRAIADSDTPEESPGTEDDNRADRGVINPVLKVSSSEPDDTFEARKQQRRGVIVRPSKQAITTTKSPNPDALNPNYNSTTLNVPNNRRRLGNHRHSRSLPINTGTLTPDRAATASSMASNTSFTDLARIQSLARRLTYQFPQDASCLRRVIADPEASLGLGMHSGPSDEALVAGGFFDPYYGADGMTVAYPAVVARPAPGSQEALLYVFIDHSNMLVGFLEWVRRQKHQNLPGISRSTKAKLSHAALVLLLERGRKCLRRVLVASSPLYQSLDEIGSMGYQLSVLQRVEIKEGTPNGKGHSRNPSSGVTTPASSSVAAFGSPSNSSQKLSHKGAKARLGRKPYASDNSHNNSGTGGTTGSSTESDSGGQQVVSQSPQPSVAARTTRRAIGQHTMTSPSENVVGNRSGSSGTPPFTPTDGSPTTAPAAASVASSSSRPRYREEAVDELLQLKLLQTLLDTPSPLPPGSTIVLASGDAARSQFNPQGFLGCVRKAIERGWNVEIVGWEDGTSRAWTELAAEVERGGIGKEVGGKMSIIGLDRPAWEGSAEALSGVCEGMGYPDATHVMQEGPTLPDTLTQGIWEWVVRHGHRPTELEQSECLWFCTMQKQMAIRFNLLGIVTLLQGFVTMAFSWMIFFRAETALLTANEHTTKLLLNFSTNHIVRMRSVQLRLKELAETNKAFDGATIGMMRDLEIAIQDYESIREYCAALETRSILDRWRFAKDIAIELHEREARAKDPSHMLNLTLSGVFALLEQAGATYSSATKPLVDI
ncbi:ATP phosphoribosyltransferase (ATP-PRTase) (ATP-PRT) [Tulasnella sp. 403]|nr:ATP phosphoribosyltransferase (ATP-PRTase) (ATP-PRT) [Tulasnella sp. 403]